MIHDTRTCFDLWGRMADLARPPAGAGGVEASGANLEIEKRMKLLLEDMQEIQVIENKS